MVLKIKELREEIGITQKELAGRIDNLQRNVSNWENGISQPDCETLIKLADVFDVSLDELLGRVAVGVSSDRDNSAEKTLIAKWRKLSPDQKTAIMQLIDTII